MYLNNIDTSYDNKDVTMQLPGGDDDEWNDADEDEGWDEIEDEDFEDRLNDRNDLYETELDENILDEDDDDHLPQDDGF